MYLFYSSSAMYGPANSIPARIYYRPVRESSGNVMAMPHKLKKGTKPSVGDIAISEGLAVRARSIRNVITQVRDRVRASVASTVASVGWTCAWATGTATIHTSTLPANTDNEARPPAVRHLVSTGHRKGSPLALRMRAHSPLRRGTRLD